MPLHLIASTRVSIDYTEVNASPGAPDDQLHRIRLDLDWRWHRPKRRPNLPKGEPRDDERPIRAIAGATVTQATTTALPFPDNSCAHVDCDSVFAYVRNDEGLARELVRVVAPGGTVRVRVPAVGPLGGLDAFNLHRYLVDITRRGLRPFETADIGWRRHYSLDDLEEMLGREYFELIQERHSGVAASEVIRMTGFVAFRWLRPSRNRYRSVSALAQRVLRKETAIAWRYGFWLECTLRRK